MPTPAELAERVFEAVRQRPGCYLVGIAGVAGSGKSTLCAELASRVPGSVVVPMDGYHLPRRVLDAEGLRRRGAPDTFDAESFRRDLARFRATRAGSFPAFDHAEKDPRPDAITVMPDAPLVFVEGLYVLMRSWQCEDLFDLRVFVDVGPETAVARLAPRHFEAGIVATLEEGRQRAMGSDRLNAKAILADGCRERADLVLDAS